MAGFLAPPPTHVTSEPSMRDILFSGYGGSGTPSEWMSESRSQYCSYMTPASYSQQPATAATPFGAATVVPQALPAQHAMVNNWMPQQPTAGGAYYVPQQPMFMQPPHLPPPPSQQQVPTVQVPVPPVAAEASASCEELSVTKAPETSKGRSKSPSTRGVATKSAAKSPKKSRPPFHTYGRANTKPTAGGFMYGDYLATHNAGVGRDIPRSHRPSAKDMGGAQVHFMEHDMRESHKRSAHYQPPRHPEPTPAPADAEDRHRAEVKEAAAAASQAAASANTTQAVANAPAAAPTSTGMSNEAANGAANADQVYASHLPAYDPAAYCYAMPHTSAPYLPYYPMPLADDSGSGAEATLAAPHAAHYPYANYAGAQPPPQLAAFVPDELGARLDPRRFKFAPRFAMASVMPAGLRSVRRDNLVVG